VKFRLTAARQVPWQSFLLLAAALMAAIVAYWPALRSPFLGDDYLLLLASREMSWPEFLRSTIDPGGDPGLLQLSANYWRPLSFLTFRLLYVVAGDHPLPYHLFNLAVHLAGVVLVHRLAHRLTGKSFGAAVAALVMALHPAGFESITWIASLNSAALPLALASWLAFMHAVDTDSGSAHRGWLAGSWLLMVLALAYRETSAVVVVAMLAWFVFCGRGERPPSFALRLGAPFAATLAAHVLLTGVLDDDGGRPLLDLNRDSFGLWWYYLKQGLVPVDPGDSGVLDLAQRTGAVALLLVPVVAVALRRWLVVTLSAAFLASLVPYALFSLGHGERYFYFPSALLALLAGAVTAAPAQVVSPRFRSDIAGRGAFAGLAAFALLLMFLLNNRVSEWVTRYPAVHEDWIHQLENTYPELPPGGGLYAVHTPFPLSRLDAYILQPTVDYEYEDESHQVFVIPDEYIDYGRSVMGPDDRMFFYEARN
jgi:hypothetical protein